MRKRYNFYLGEKMLAALQVVAKHGDTTVSEVIRTACKEHLNRIRDNARGYATDRPTLPPPNDKLSA
jgi:hypothetical protein